MKILLLSHSAAREGAPIALLTLAAAYAEHGHDCTVVSPTRGAIARDCTANTIRFRAMSHLYEAQPPVRALNRLLQRLQPDVVVINTLLGAHLLPQIRTLLPAAHLLLWIHESQPEEFFAVHRHLSPEHLGIADTVCVASEASRSLYTQWAPHASVLHPAIHSPTLAALCEETPQSSARHALGLPADATVVLCVANLSVRKAQCELARAFSRVAAALPEQNLHLVFAGKNIQGRYARVLRTLCKAQGIAERTHILPSQQNVATLYRAADIAVTPSFIECYPLAVAEAMAAGLPVIAAESYGSVEQIRDGENGLLVAPGNVPELEAALLRLLKNPTLATALGEKAKSYARSYHTPLRLYEESLLLLPAVPATEPPLQGMYRFFSLLKKIWVRCGCPFPTFTRRFRSQVFGATWPLIDHSMQPPTADILRSPSGPDARVAVVITSHNYGRFLPHAIDSVLRQTVQPSRILVVSDASTDNTVEIAKRYAAKDARIEIVEGQWRNVGQARNTALRMLTQEYQVYLDADDALHPLYLEEGIRVLHANPQAGMAYPDNQFFGNITRYHRNPAQFDWRIFDRHNHINTVSMMRRTALVQAGGWYDVPSRHADWITARHMLALGWQALHTDGVHFYRKHGNNMFDRYREALPYVERSALAELPLTLFLSLSGREWAWPLQRAFLERQTLDHSRIHLFILDTAHNPQFSAEVRRWLAECDYGSITHQRRRVGRSNLPSMDRDAVRQEMRDACATIYNIFARNCFTPLALFLEDDVIPPDDAFEHLIRQLTPDAVSVSGFYRHRNSSRPIAWGWSATGIPRDYEAIPSGTTVVGGTGFGCSVVRGERLRHTVFSSGLPLLNYDQNFYRTAVFEEKQKALLDWDCVCRHYSDAHTWW